MLKFHNALLLLSLLGSLAQVSANLFSLRNLLSRRQECGGGNSDPGGCYNLCASEQASCIRENDDGDLCSDIYSRCLASCSRKNNGYYSVGSRMIALRRTDVLMSAMSFSQAAPGDDLYTITCDERDAARQRCIQYYVQDSCPTLCQYGNTGSSQGLLECLDGIPQCSLTPAADTNPSSTNKNIPSNKHRQRAAPADSKLKFGR